MKTKKMIDSACIEAMNDVVNVALEVGMKQGRAEYWINKALTISPREIHELIQEVLDLYCLFDGSPKVCLL